jgi:Peptidase S24-like
MQAHDMSSSRAQPLSILSAKGTTSALVASLLGDGYDVRLRVTGWSMKPLIRSGSVLHFSASGSPRAGDVVLTRHANGSLVAHRVIEIDGDWIRTKGDACRTADGRVQRSAVVACAVGWEGPVPFCLPLRGRFMRTAGLVLNRLYPLLVAAFRAAIPRKKQTC